MVSPEKHIWHDFSSGRGGDVFSFVMEVEGVDFKGALELLARKAGIDLGQYRMGDGSLSKKKERLYEANELAAKYYQQSLIKNKTALEYVVKKRRMNKQVVQDFRIGYSPNTEGALYTLLIKRGFSDHELRDAGLAVIRRHGPGDMFRGRIMVPLMDPQGRVIGFTARILQDEPNAPKYINTPQTLLYDKGRHIFGLHLAKESIRQSDSVVVVEGNLDVIASHQAGIKNVVATAGTAMTENHLRSLSRFTQDVRLAFDADKAGVNATERAIAVASNMGINLSIIVLPPGEAKDADELVKKDPKLWQAAIDSPVDAVEWLLNTYAQRFDLTSAEGKRRATDQALNVVRGIEDPVLREHYMQKIAARIGSSMSALSSKLLQQSEPVRRVVNKEVRPMQQEGPDQYAYQDYLLALAWAHPQVRDSLAKVEPEMFAGKPRQLIASAIKQEGQDAVAKVRKTLQSDDVQVKIGELELIVETKYPTFTDAHYYEAVDIVKRIKKEHKIVERTQLAARFSQSEDKSERTHLNKLIKQLNQEIEALKH